MVAKMNIKNMNFGYFNFEGGLAIMQYRGMTIGQSQIEHGFVNPMGIKEMIVTMDASSNKPVSLGSDISLGILKLSSHA